MAGPRRLNKALWSNLTKMKLSGRVDAPVRFVLERSPFDDVEDDDALITAEQNDCVIIGLIFPHSEIYRHGAYRIELKLTANYPAEAPEVRFLTPLYHPNVAANGKFCHHLLNNHSRWKLSRETSLMEVIKTVVKHIDEPDPDYAVTFDIGKEYTQRRAEFDRKALEMVREHALPRT